ncbi:MAG TPA: hypothetical protein VMS22_11520 [Candidatus Eisenbacteria bacterium]|nr:hypothetical protein [Candidatus Eisenbacteria bacterium]
MRGPGAVGWVALVLGAGAAAAVLLTWPLVRAPGATILDDSTLDGFQFVWNSWWVRRAVHDGTDPFYTRLLFAPDGIGLFWHTLGLTTGLLSLAFARGDDFTHAVWAHNATNLVAVPATVALVALLVRCFVDRPGVAAVAGLVAVASPFYARQLHGPHLGALWAVALVLLAWQALPARRTWPAAVAAVAAFAVLFGASQDYAAMALVVCGVDLVVRALSRGARRWVLGEAVVLACVVAVIMLAARVLGSELPERPPFRWIVWNSAYLSGFVTPPWLGRERPWLYFESSIYLGLVPLAGALLAQVVAPREATRWNLAALACLAIALGPMLQLGPPSLELYRQPGEVPPVWPGWPTPYRLLYELVPGFAMSRGPWRWVGGARLCLVVATACGLGVLARRASWRTAAGVGIALVVLSFAETLPHRLHAVPALMPAGYRVLESDPGDYVVVDLPSGLRRGSFALFSSYYMAYQTGHHRPLVDGTVARLPGARRHLFERPDFRLADHPEVRYVVLHRMLFRQVYPRGPSVRLAKEARASGRLVYRDRSTRVYRMG